MHVPHCPNQPLRGPASPFLNYWDQPAWLKTASDQLNTRQWKALKNFPGQIWLIIGTVNVCFDSYQGSLGQELNIWPNKEIWKFRKPQIETFCCKNPSPKLVPGSMFAKWRIFRWAPQIMSDLAAWQSWVAILKKIGNMVHYSVWYNGTSTCLLAGGFMRCAKFVSSQTRMAPWQLPLLPQLAWHLGWNHSVEHFLELSWKNLELEKSANKQNKNSSLIFKTRVQPILTHCDFEFPNHPRTFQNHEFGMFFVR